MKDGNLLTGKQDGDHCNSQEEAADIVVLLKACARLKDLHKGTTLHTDICKSGLLKKSRYVGNNLINMYAKCGALAEARRVLDELPVRDVVSWSALITGYAQQGRGEEALKCFDQMQFEGHAPNAVTYICILKACGSVGAATKGKQIHDEIVKQGLLKRSTVLGNALVDMYVKCGVFAKAREVLNELPVRNVVSWSALIAGYAQQGQGEEALKCFEQMKHEGHSPNAVTFICVLKACGSVGAAYKGEDIHDELGRTGLLEKNIVLGTALVDMYVKCGALAKARRVLGELPDRNVVSWSALIAGYAEHGQGEEALDCFEQMQREGHSPDAVTFCSILKACGIVGAADMGERIHGDIVKHGLLNKNIVLGNALVDMYAKCCAPTKARQVLDELPVRDVVSWSALIAGYAQQGQCEEALNCFEQMQCEGHSPDTVTFIYIVKACASMGAVDKGKQIHDMVDKQGLLEKSVLLASALVDMYAKCGALAKAARVLDDLPVRSLVSWNALIAGYSQQGQSGEVLHCFEQMQCEGLSPDSSTLLSVLNSCSHAGLLYEGQMYFSNMSTKFGITPVVEHHCCMVDLFGRAGEFNKALAVIEMMPSCDYLPVWLALLGACRKWGNINLGRLAFDHAVQVDITAAAAYVSMANIYAAAGMEESAE